MIDFDLGTWRAVPGMFSPEDGATVQIAVKRVPAGQAVVEMGAWCGRSLASICEVLHPDAVVYSYDNYLEDSQATAGGSSPIPPRVAMTLRQTVEAHYRSIGKNVFCAVMEASEAGRVYRGPLISVLFIDDHHSAKQLEKKSRRLGATSGTPGDHPAARLRAPALRAGRHLGPHSSGARVRVRRNPGG